MCPRQAQLFPYHPCGILKHNRVCWMSDTFLFCQPLKGLHLQALELCYLTDRSWKKKSFSSIKLNKSCRTKHLKEALKKAAESAGMSSRKKKVNSFQVQRHYFSLCSVYQLHWHSQRVHRSVLIGVIHVSIRLAWTPKGLMLCYGNCLSGNQQLLWHHLGTL